eukprot:3937396-Rhodomonas_salina.3
MYECTIQPTDLDAGDGDAVGHRHPCMCVHTECAMSACRVRSVCIHSMRYKTRMHLQAWTDAHASASRQTYLDAGDGDAVELVAIHALACQRCLRAPKTHTMSVSLQHQPPTSHSKRNGRGFNQGSLENWGWDTGEAEVGHRRTRGGT